MLAVQQIHSPFVRLPFCVKILTQAFFSQLLVILAEIAQTARPSLSSSALAYSFSIAIIGSHKVASRSKSFDQPTLAFAAPSFLLLPLLVL